MKENRLVVDSIDFAVSVLKICENIKVHRSVVNQIERSATSIGANIREANYAHGTADFISKLKISLKECYETEYWIEIMQKVNMIDDDTAKKLMHNCGSLGRMLIASINTAKENNK